MPARDIFWELDCKCLREGSKPDDKTLGMIRMSLKVLAFVTQTCNPRRQRSGGSWFEVSLGK
jgi:hypothetical protein